MKTRTLQSRPLRGQSLVEFVMVMPVLLLILLGAFTVGLGIYQGANASMAVKSPVMQKIELAKNPGDTTNSARDMIMNYNSGSLQMGNAIDRSRTVGTGNHTTVIIATKEFQPPVAFLPMVDFTVTQAINTNLLLANQGSASPTINAFGAIGGYPVSAPPALPPDPVLAGACPTDLRLFAIVLSVQAVTTTNICTENFGATPSSSNSVQFNRNTPNY